MLDVLKPTRLFMPVLLSVMCGLRRGEVIALRWRNVNLDGKSIAIVERAEQTKDGVRYKEPKSGRARTIALSPTVISELRGA